MADARAAARARRRPPAAPDRAASILVVDDAPDTLELVRRILTMRGYRVLTAARAADAVAALEATAVDLVITDIRMPDRSGLDLIRDVRARWPALEIIVITGYPTIEGAVEALHLGAWDYLAKPFTDDELLHAVRRVLGRRAGAGPAAPDRLAEFHGLLGEALVTRALFAELAAAAAAPGAVLLRGEPGSGRESAARALHAASGRSGRFVRVSLDGRGTAGIAPEIAEALSASRGGTLYAASLEAMSASRASELTEALGARRAAPRGGAPARIVASTALSTEALARRGGAWGSLLGRFDRAIVVPPLRERGDDAVRLATRFLAELTADAGVPVRLLAAATARAIRGHAWPGNVAELRGLMTAIAAAPRPGPVMPAELPEHVARADSGEAGEAGDDLSLVSAESRHIAAVLRRTGGNKSRAAEVLGIDRKTLREKLRLAGESALDDDRE